MGKIDNKKLAEELQKAKFRGESAAEVLKRLTPKETSQQKKRLFLRLPRMQEINKGNPFPKEY